MGRYNKLDLERMLIEEGLSYESVGRTFGVTGNSIKKAAIRLGIELTKRRKINKCEIFSKNQNARPKVYDWTDDEFCDIINSNNNWKDIYASMGYRGKSGSKAKKKIIDRCNKLKIKPNTEYVPPVLLKTKGELLLERGSYQKYRETVRKMSEKIYKKSGRPKRCAVCGYDKFVEIAHIKAVSEFDESALISDINSIDNLIALCPNHHWEYDNGVLILRNNKI